MFWSSGTSMVAAAFLVKNEGFVYLQMTGQFPGRVCRFFAPEYSDPGQKGPENLFFIKLE